MQETVLSEPSPALPCFEILAMEGGLSGLALSFFAA
jgi:hypothetical protein